MQHRRTSFLASHELLSELASEVAKACTNTKPASPKLYEVSSSVFNGHVDRVLFSVTESRSIVLHVDPKHSKSDVDVAGKPSYTCYSEVDVDGRVFTHVPLLGDAALEALPCLLLCCSQPEATAADAYIAWLDQLAAYPVVGTLTLEWTGDRNDCRSPDLFFINVLLLSLFILPLLLKHGLELAHTTAKQAGLLRLGINYRYSMEHGFVPQSDSLVPSGRDLINMTPAELASLPPSVLEQALNLVQHERGMLLQEQGFLEAIMEGDEGGDSWAMVEGTDESTACAESSTPSVSVGGAPLPTADKAGSTHRIDDHTAVEGAKKRRRAASQASCSSSTQARPRDGSKDDDEEDSGDGHGRRQQQHWGGLWSAAAPAASSSGGGSGGDDTRVASSSDKRMRSKSVMGAEENKALAQGLCLDPYTLQFQGAALEHSFVRYRAVTMRHNEPYVNWIAIIIGMAVAVTPAEGRLSPVCMRCLQVGVVLRALRMALYSLPLQRMLPRLDALERVQYLREMADFLLHVGIALVVIPRYIRDVMGLLPLGLHTLLMIIVMPVYLYFMCTQSFVAMRFVWARWLVGGMFAGFSVGSVAMPVLGCWPLPLSMQLACVGGCWALQGAATTAAMLRLRAVEKSARRDFAALVEQRM